MSAFVPAPLGEARQCIKRGPLPSLCSPRLFAARLVTLQLRTSNLEQADREQPAAADSKQDEDSPEIACVRELAASEEAFQSKLDAKALSEADAEKLIQLLDDADAACGEGDVRGAREKLETVNETVAKAK